MSLVTLHSNIQQHYLQHQFANKATLIEEPIGWKTSNKKISRSKKTGEIIEKNAKDISFIGKGRDYINTADALYGSNCKIQYIVLTQNPKDATDYFQDIYFIDLESIKDKKGKLSCKVDEGGLAKLLKAKQNEKVELERTTSLEDKPITELEKETLLLSGRRIFLRSVLEGDAETTAKTRIKTLEGYRFKRVPYPLNIRTNSHLDFVFTPFANEYEFTPDGSHLFFLQNDRAKTLNFTLSGSFWVNTVKLILPHNDTFRRLTFVVYQNGSNYDFKENIVVWEDPTPRNTTRRKITFSKNFTYDLASGESIGLIFENGGTFGNDTFLDDNPGYYHNDFEECEGELTIEEDSSLASSTTKCLYTHETGERLLEILTGKKKKFYSKFFGRQEIGYKKDGLGSNMVVLALLWARGFETRDKKRPSTSLKDFIDSVCAIWGCSSMIEKIGFSERLRIEDLNFFYNHNITISLPNVVEDLEKEYAREFLYSSFETGYNKGGSDYEEATGIGEYNGKSEFSTIRNTTEKKSSKLSKYRGDSSAFEFARRKHLSIAPQEDTRYDSEWGVIDTKKGVTEVLEERKWQDDFEQEPREIYSPETATNLRLTPFQMLQRRKFFVTGSLSHYPDSKLNFINSNCNSDLELKPNGQDTIKENQNTILSDVGRARFKPYWWKFKHNVDFKIQKQLREKTVIEGKEVYNFYGLVEFKVSQNEYKYGYLFEVNENKGEWQILEANI